MKSKSIFKIVLIMVVLISLVSCDVIIKKPKKCTVTFNGNGSTSGEMVSQVVEYNTDLKLSPIEYKIGDIKASQWATDPTGKFLIDDEATIRVTEDMTLYAYWGDNQPFTIHFLDKEGQVKLHTRTGETDIIYTVNGGELVHLTSTTDIDVPANSVISFYAVRTENDSLNFKCTENCTVFGNVMSLIYGDDFTDPTKTDLFEEAFYNLLKGNTGLTDASNLILPSMTLAEGCYDSMFQNCSYLVSAPKLPATNLAKGCYMSMFMACVRLKKAPELPATTLQYACYYDMFKDCKSLKKAPVLAAPVLAPYCYDEMFQNCTKLKYVKCLATNTDATDCTFRWLYNVTTEDGTFVRDPSKHWAYDSERGVPKGWEIIDN